MKHNEGLDMGKDADQIIDEMLDTDAFYIKQVKLFTKENYDKGQKPTSMRNDKTLDFIQWYDFKGCFIGVDCDGYFHSWNLDGKCTSNFTNLYDLVIVNFVEKSDDSKGSYLGSDGQHIIN